MWRVASIQGHFDPWHPRLLDKTEVQLDAILEAYSEDYPAKLKFKRRRKGEHSLDTVEALSVQWADKLIGKAQTEFRNKVSFKIPDAYSPVRRSPRQAPRRRP